jgi:alanine racemase
MQTSFVELEPSDKTGDPVTLLSPDLPPETVAKAWSSSPHEVLLRLSAFAPQSYVE